MLGGGGRRPGRIRWRAARGSDVGAFIVVAPVPIPAPPPPPRGADFRYINFSVGRNFAFYVHNFFGWPGFAFYLHKLFG